MKDKDDRLLKLKMDLDGTVLSSVQQIYKVKKGLKNKLTKKEVEIGLLKSISENFLRLKQIDDEMEKHIENFVLFVDERLERERDFNLLKDLTALELMENKDLNTKIQKAIKLQGRVEYEDKFPNEVDKLHKINQNDHELSKYMKDKDDRLLKLKMDLDGTVLSSVQQIYKVKKGLKNKLTKKEVEIGLLKSISENFLRLKQIDDEMEKHIENFVLFVDERLERERDFNLLKDLTALELMENKDLNTKIQKAIKLQGRVEYEDKFPNEVDKLHKINQNDHELSKYMKDKDDRLLKLKMDLDGTVLSSVQQIYKVKKGLKNKLTKKEVEIGLLKSISENFLRLKQIDDEMEKHIENFVLFVDERLERERDFNLLKDLTALELMENKDLNTKIQKAIKLQGRVEYEDKFPNEVDKLHKINQNDHELSK